MSRPTIKKKSKNEVFYGDQKFTRQEVLDAYNEVEQLINEPTEQKDGSFKAPLKHREVTRKWFREAGVIPEPVMEALFGTFLEYKRAVGKQPTRAQNTLNSQIARNAAADNLRKVWTERLDYGALYRRDSGRRHQIILGFNDLHDEECDPFLRRILIDLAKRVQPDIIVSNGDHYDAPEFGKYPNDPREWDVVRRVEAGVEIFKDLREAAPNARIDLIEGNHEARVIRHFTEMSPSTRAMLSDFHKMDMRKFLGLDRNEVNYIAKTDMKGAYTDTNIRSEVKRNYEVYFNCFCAHHFPQGRLFGMPGWNGHHHSFKADHYHSARFGAYNWFQFGAGHRRDATYTNGEKWSNGLGLIHIDTVSGLSQVEYFNVGTTFAVIAGQRYVRREDEYYPALYPMIDKDRIILFPEEPTLILPKKPALILPKKKAK